MEKKSLTTSSFATATAMAIALLVASAEESAFAREFTLGEVMVDTETTVTVGAALRTSDRNCEFISSFNTQGCDAGGDSDNLDDGNLNYDRGDFVSARTDATSEIEVNWREYGAFIRANYYFDGINSNVSHTRRTDLSDSARHLSGRGFRLLDAYVFADLDLMGMPLHLRLGNQVVNWGESSSIGGGINSYNTFDVSKLRTAGASLKEALLPIPMVNFSIEPIEDWQLSAFYMFDWKETLLDPVGTFYSTDDIYGPGREGIFYGPNTPGAVGDPGAARVRAEDLLALGGGARLLRDRTPDNDGQWGVAAHHFNPDLNAEFGLYYVKYHHRTPIRGAITNCDAFLACSSGYYREFVGEQSLYGVSTRFLVGDVSIGAEANYRPDTPIQRRDVVADSNTAATTEAFLTGLDATSEINGVLRTNRAQIQANMAYQVGPSSEFAGALVSALGMERAALSAEVAAVHFNKRPVGSDLNGKHVAWKYVVGISGDYSRLFGAPLSLTPYASFTHTPFGNELDDLDVFKDNRKQLTVGASFVYESEWVFDVGYTNNFGAGKANRQRDRDFVSLSLSHAF